MKVFVTCQDDAASTQQLLRIEKKLGEGKFNVYHVYSPSSKANYALKVFPTTPFGAEHYKRELILSNLSHQNIIQYIPVKCTSTDYYGIITEYTKYGDLLNLITSRGAFNSETLIRTYFHQLIDGLEYLHSQGLAHLDLKLENLVLGNDFSLKIIDFDQAQMINENELTSAGTPSCRAPEVIQENCQDLAAADIYSLGVILFALKAGQYPFVEINEQEGTHLFPYSLFLRNNKGFWKEKATFLEAGELFDKDFIELVNEMLQYNPNKRYTIKEIKDSKWYQGAVLSKENLRAEMKTIWSDYMKQKNKAEQIY